MLNQQGLIHTLQSTSAVLSAVRKSIATSGNLDAMREIDTLLAVAQSETEATVAALGAASASSLRAHSRGS